MMRYLNFLGTRGSCPVSGKEFQKYGGNSSCLEVVYDDTSFIIDAGTGIFHLNSKFLKNQEEIHLFLGHFHLDHLIGLPFFTPVFEKERLIHFWLPAKNQETGKDLLDHFFSSQFFPGGLDQMKANFRFLPAFEDIPVKMKELSIHFCQMQHPGLTYGFKIITPHQTIGYATDNEFMKIEDKLSLQDQKIIDFFQGTDLLIHEAQFFDEEYLEKQGWGHSSISKALHLVRKINPKKWLVVHHDPNHDDATLDAMEKIAKTKAQEMGFQGSIAWIFDHHIETLQ